MRLISRIEDYYGISGAYQHLTLPQNKALGLWIDGPLTPYKTHGQIYTHWPHFTAYRMHSPNLDRVETWKLDGEPNPMPYINYHNKMVAGCCYASEQDHTEGNYNFNVWPFAPVVDPSNNDHVYYLAHAEWHSGYNEIEGVRYPAAGSQWDRPGPILSPARSSTPTSCSMTPWCATA